MTGRLIEGRIGERVVPVYVGAGNIADLEGAFPPDAGATALIVHDAAVAHIADLVERAVSATGRRVVRLPVPSGEPSKSMAELERLSRAAALAGLRRADTVIAVGGGVVGDLGGFLAATYQRGVGLIHVPTTLLAMVDSAIGGKTGVDLPEGKNYVGAVWQPRLVMMDVTFLDTLPPRELAAGFAEVIKYGLLEGGELGETVAAWPTLPGPREALTDLIVSCVRHKLAVVAEDEFDLGGRRATLNLGHTVGHGIEAAAGYERYLHGEAISLGMLAALRISEGHVGLDPRVREATKNLIDRHGLPTRLDEDVAVSAILAAMGRDKKADAQALNMVLLTAPGEPLIRQSPPPELVETAIRELYDR